MAWGIDLEDRHTDAGPLGVGLVTLVIGAAIGVAATLLLAPPNGRDLRTRALNAASNWKSSVAEALAQGRERMVSGVEQDRGVPPGGEIRPVERGIVRPT
jgi:hypothetical protein